MKRVLVVDDERRMRRILQIMLEQMDLEAVGAESGEAALQILEKEQVALVLTDLKMPGMSGVDLLQRIRERDADVPVVVLTAHGTVETAVAAMKAGALDYVLKPFDLEVVELIIRRALELRQVKTENRYLREQVAAAPVFESLVGDSSAMRAIHDLLRQVGPTRSTVLITGETGTGKELVARAIHNLSPRRDKLFVPVNCAAIPAELLESEIFGHARGAFTGAVSERIGKFELADAGTIFLDEIGDMAHALQAKLLRVLEEGVLERVGTNKRITVDVRVIASTNRDLDAARLEGTFREDLYYRLNVFHIHVPPLRERREDVAPLASFYLEKSARELGKHSLRLGAEALRRLEGYAFPGNVRELRNLMERAAVLAQADVIEAEFVGLDLPRLQEPGGRPEQGFLLQPALQALERKLILRALAAAGDNKTRAAQMLGVGERTLWYKLKRYGL